MLAAIGQLLITLLNIYLFIIIAGVVISWLIAFDVINTRNPQAGNLVRLIERITQPVYAPLRKFIPPIGGIDITPIIIIFGIYLLQSLIGSMFFSAPAITITG
ncbi:YggT family protein [Micavibrio aeruginosavorus]|uniref:YggT family protein n=1 Tax=Micavibrio aeruginosavorus TaxID=349221 RepID=UPI003F4A9608